MDKETYEALKLLMDKLERYVIHTTYQENSKEAYKKVEEWIEEVAKDYNKQKYWFCPDCNEKEFSWDMEDVAEKGTPVCPKCDHDMIYG